MNLFERVLAEAQVRPDVKSRNLAKMMRNVRKRAVRTSQRLDPERGSSSGDQVAQNKVSHTLRPGSRSRPRCDYCNKRKPDVRHRDDDYAQDVNNERNAKHVACDRCDQTSREGI